MQIPFEKLQGCGNDYVYFNGFDPDVRRALSKKSEAQLAEWIRRISDRHFGVGGDGVILALPEPGFDGRMRMFNADGSEGRMCGNGIRCVAKLLYDHKIAAKDVLRIQTGSGPKEVRAFAKNGQLVSAAVSMGAPIWSTAEIPMCFPEETCVRQPLRVGGRDYLVTCVSMGNPHCVVFGQDPAALDLPALGPLFEHHTAFPQSVNTEFALMESATRIRMRVWERGSGETLACGTGASAVACAAVRNGLSPANTPITLVLLGGELKITVTDETVWMEGPAERSFTGLVEAE